MFTIYFKHIQLVHKTLKEIVLETKFQSISWNFGKIKNYNQN